MKKIKFLLLGIVSIFGIGLSLGNDSLTYFSKYTTSNNSNAGEYINLSDGSYNFGDDCVILRDGSTWSIDGENWYTGNGHDLLCGGPVYFSGVSSVYVLYFTGAFFYNSLPVYGSTGDDLAYSAQYEIVPGYSLFPYSSPDSCVSVLRPRYSGIEFYSEPGVKIGDMDNGYGILICGEFYFFNIYGESKYFDGLYLYSGAFHSSSNGGGDSSSPFSPVLTGGLFDFNIFLIEKTILCYMSSGTFGGNYGNCDGIDYSGFVNQFDHNNPIWSGSSESGYIGSINFFDASAVLSYYCLNTDSIQYQFCSQLYLYSGADLMYFYENGKLDYYVLGSGFGVDLGNLGSGQLGELTCTGVWCDGNINTGLPEYIIPEESEDSFGFSGSYLSAEFFDDFVSSGFFFRCPFPYSGSYFTLGKKVIDALGGRDLLIPINCFIAGYSAGVETSFFGDPDYGRFRSGSLLSGSTPGHQRLFLLFDIIISFGLVFFFIKMFNFLFGHG